jgi:hypothetical protein
MAQIPACRPAKFMARGGWKFAYRGAGASNRNWPEKLVAF